jgi:hypothetical protein
LLIANSTISYPLIPSQFSADLLLHSISMSEECSILRTARAKEFA